MKTVHKFLVTCALAATIIPFATVACGVETECEVDEDCTAPDECNEILGVCEAAGEGEGEGEEGEGEEGEGEGGDCDTSGFADEAGNGLEASDATLEADGDNTAGCGLCFPSAVECASDDECEVDDIGCVGPGADPFLATFIISDNTIADIDADSVSWSEDGGDPLGCTSFPVAVEDGGINVVACPICFITVPTDMAIQYDDGVDTSNATCVEIL